MLNNGVDAMATPRHPALLCLLLLLLTLAPPAANADDLARARQHFARAETQYRLGKFAEALAQYQAAFRHASLPRLLFNMAQCHRHLGQRKKALFYYKLFRDDWKRRFPGTRPPNDAEVMERIRTLQKELASTGEPSSRPAPSSLPVLESDSSRAVPGSGTRAPKTGAAAPPESPTPRVLDEPPPFSHLRRPWAWVAAGAGAAALGVGMGLLATRRVDEIVWSANGPPQRVTDSPVPGAVLLGAGVAAGALSCYLFIRGEAPVQAGLGVSSAGLVASVWGSF